MCNPKEPNWFCDDYPTIREAGSIEEYHSFFTPATVHHSVVCEASSIYLYSQNAIANIFNYNPKSKIIVHVRNPIDLLYSWHSQLVFNLVENEKNFVEAWRLQDKRRGRPFLQYGKIGSHGSQVQRLFSIFDQQQVHVVLFDDLKSDTSQVYKDTLRFLHIPFDGRTNFPKVNESKCNVLPFVTKMLRCRSDFILNYLELIKRTFNIQLVGVSNFILNRNYKIRTLPPLPAAFRLELFNYFKADIKLLSDQIGRDLSHWR